MLHPRLSTPVPPKGGTLVIQGKHGRQRELEIFHSAIRAPRSGRILLRRDPFFQLANTVVNEDPKRAFQPAIDLGLQAVEMRQARKNGEVCALPY